MVITHSFEGYLTLDITLISAIFLANHVKRGHVMFRD